MLGNPTPVSGPSAMRCRPARQRLPPGTRPPTAPPIGELQLELTTSHAPNVHSTQSHSRSQHSHTFASANLESGQLHFSIEDLIGCARGNERDSRRARYKAAHCDPPHRSSRASPSLGRLATRNCAPPKALWRPWRLLPRMDTCIEPTSAARTRIEQPPRAVTRTPRDAQLRPPKALWRSWRPWRSIPAHRHLNRANLISASKIGLSAQTGTCAIRVALVTRPRTPDAPHRSNRPSPPLGRIAPRSAPPRTSWPPWQSLPVSTLAGSQLQWLRTRR
jgi:hypothetical protein